MIVMNARRLCAVAIAVLVACFGCDSKPNKTIKAECLAIMSIGATTYWGVHVDMPLGTHALGRGDLSSCADGVRPHHQTGMFVTAYTVRGFDPSEALISPGGPGDPLTLWIATNGSGPPFVASPRLQRLIDDHPVPAWMLNGVN